MSRPIPKPSSLNESPSEKEGKYVLLDRLEPLVAGCLNESPSEKEGKSLSKQVSKALSGASMKALLKRKGNILPRWVLGNRTMPQ